MSKTRPCSRDLTLAANPCPSPPAAPANGVRITNGTSGVTDNVWTFACNAGFVLSGSQATTCTAAGTWTATTPVCARGSCGTVPVGSLANASLACAGSLFQDQCNMTCARGFNLSGPATTQCLSSLTWSMSLGSCLPIVCAPLIAPAFGTLVLPSRFVDSLASFTCDPGYRLSGAAAATCLPSGLWSSTVPTCMRISCPAMSAPGYASSCPTTWAGDVCNVNCNSSLVLGSGSAGFACTLDGVWQARGECIAPMCTSPTAALPAQARPSTLTAFTNTSQSWPVGATVGVTCIAGSLLAGPASIQCIYPGTWTSTACSTINVSAAFAWTMSGLLAGPSLTLPVEEMVAVNLTLAGWSSVSSPVYLVLAGPTALSVNTSTSVTLLSWPALANNSATTSTATVFSLTLPVGPFTLQIALMLAGQSSGTSQMRALLFDQTRLTLAEAASRAVTSLVESAPDGSAPLASSALFSVTSGQSLPSLSYSIAFDQEANSTHEAVAKATLAISNTGSLAAVDAFTGIVIPPGWQISSFSTESTTAGTLPVNVTYIPSGIVISLGSVAAGQTLTVRFTLAFPVSNATTLPPLFALATTATLQYRSFSSGTMAPPALQAVLASAVLAKISSPIATTPPRPNAGVVTCSSDGSRCFVSTDGSTWKPVDSRLAAVSTEDPDVAVTRQGTCMRKGPAGDWRVKPTHMCLPASATPTLPLSPSFSQLAPPSVVGAVAPAASSSSLFNALLGAGDTQRSEQATTTLLSVRAEGVSLLVKQAAPVSRSASSLKSTTTSASMASLSPTTAPPQAVASAANASAQSAQAENSAQPRDLLSASEAVAAQSADAEPASKQSSPGVKK
jgi:hypothetical protein